MKAPNPLHSRPVVPKKAAAAPIVAPGRSGGVIAAKGPVLGAVMKGMGHSKAPLTGISTDRGSFKIKG
jgi:hypothetical protein